MTSVQKVHKHTNRIASYLSVLHDNAGPFVMSCLRVRNHNNVNVQAFRDTIADEIRMYRRVQRKAA